MVCEPCDIGDNGMCFEVTPPLLRSSSKSESVMFVLEHLVPHGSTIAKLVTSSAQENLSAVSRAINTSLMTQNVLLSVEVSRADF